MPSEFVRPPAKQVKDLREKFLEILDEEMDGVEYTVRYREALERAVDRLIDEVTSTTILDPE